MDNSSEKRLLELIRRTGAYSKKEKWLYLNTLWYHPETRIEFSSLIIEYLYKITVWTPTHVLLVVESVASTYSLIPVITYAVDKIGCRLAIWREVLPVSISESWIIPPKIEKNLRCVIVQGVSSKGSTLRRLASDLNFVGWQPEEYVALARDDSNLDTFISNFEFFRNNVVCRSNFNYHTLLNLSEI